jgi:hypothetical protein
MEAPSGHEARYSLAGCTLKAFESGSLPISSVSALYFICSTYPERFPLAPL